MIKFQGHEQILLKVSGWNQAHTEKRGSNILDFLDTHSGAIQAFATCVLVLITCYYAWQTQRTVNEIKKQTKVQQMPIVKISTHPVNGGTFDFKNIGKGAALNVEKHIFLIDDGGNLTNKGNFEEDVRLGLFCLGEREVESGLTSGDLLAKYQTGEIKAPSGGTIGEYAIVAKYEDINRNPYYTIAKFRSPHTLIGTNTGDYERGKFSEVRYLMG